MEIEVITKEDLQLFKAELLKDITELLKPAELKKPWLKNNELKRLLNISSATIQRLRVAGKLRPTKIGGTHYYSYAEIEKLMGNNIELND